MRTGRDFFRKKNCLENKKQYSVIYLLTFIKRVTMSKNTKKDIPAWVRSEIKKNDQLKSIVYDCREKVTKFSVDGAIKKYETAVELCKEHVKSEELIDEFSFDTEAMVPFRRNHDILYSGFSGVLEKTNKPLWIIKLSNGTTLCGGGKSPHGSSRPEEVYAFSGKIGVLDAQKSCCYGSETKKTIEKFDKLCGKPYLAAVIKMLYVANAVILHYLGIGDMFLSRCYLERGRRYIDDNYDSAYERFECEFKDFDPKYLLKKRGIY